MRIWQNLHSAGWRATLIYTRQRHFTLAGKIFNNFFFLNVTLARLASDFDFTLANDNQHSPWRYGDAYVHPWNKDDEFHLSQDHRSSLN